MIPLRALPRVFLPGASAEDVIPLPAEEVEKFRKVLRLESGAEIVVLPGDGSMIRCQFVGRMAEPLDVTYPDVEPKVSLTLAQALPKGDKLDEIVRFCTSLGVNHFVLFPSERSVVRWDVKKTEDRLRRLGVIAREACEVSFRTRMPTFSVQANLGAVLASDPACRVLSEAEGLLTKLPTESSELSIVVGPEGGWSPAELALIGDRAVSLGPRVLRTEHAGPAAAALLLLG